MRTLGLAALTTTQVGFFTVVATILPVFLLGYIVAVSNAARVVGDFSGRLLRRTFAGGMALNYAFAAVLMVAFGAPAWGEYTALHVLYTDHATAANRQVCFVTTIIGGALVLVPFYLRTIPSRLLSQLANQLVNDKSDSTTDSDAEDL